MPTLESLDQVDDALLDYIVKGCESMIVSETVLLDKLKKLKKDVYGRNILIKYRLKGNAGAGSAPERGTLPQAKARTFKEGSLKLRYVYFPVEITGQEYHVPHGKKGAIFDIVVDAFEDTMELGLHKVDNYFWGNGTGRLAQINGTPTYAAGTGLTTVNFDNGVKEHFLEGQDVTIGTNSTLWEIDSIDEDNDRIYLSGDATGETADDLWIYNGGDYASGYDRVPWGLGIHISDSHSPHSSYQSLSRTTNSWLNAYVNDNSGVDRLLTILLMTQHFQKIKRRGGRIPSVLITEDGVLNSYTLLLEDKHQPIEPMPSEDGTKEQYKFVFQGKRIIIETSMKCPLGTMWNVDPEVLQVREALPLTWDKIGGGKLQKDKDVDVIWGRMKWYYNMICTNNKRLGVLKDITRNAIT